MKLIEIIENNPGILWNNNPSSGTDKHGAHDYINGFYDKAFEPFKDKEINLLEIGIQYGSSLALWRQYFSKANIYGIDVVDNRQQPYVDLPGINYIFDNAYSELNLPNFDIVIDDGPHTLESMLDCIRIYLPKVNEGGIFVIEDVQDVSWFTNLTNAVPEEYKDRIEYLDLRATYNRYDDLMFIIKK